MRPRRDNVLMAIAEIIASRGTCDRKQVGAVISIEGRPVSWGYNGAPPGLPHCNENYHGWRGKGLYESDEDTLEQRQEADAAAAENLGCINATHAEANALAFAARMGISTEGATLFVTLSPCATCARLLIAAGIKRVVWSETYRERDGIALLSEAGVEWVAINDRVVRTY